MAVIFLNDATAETASADREPAPSAVDANAIAQASMAAWHQPDGMVNPFKIPRCVATDATNAALRSGIKFAGLAILRASEK